MGVIDRLERVEITEHHRAVSSRTSPVADDGLKLLDRLAPSQQAGQVVVRRPPLQLLLGCDLGVDRAEGYDAAVLLPSVVDEGSAMDLDPAVFAALVQHPQAK